MIEKEIFMAHRTSPAIFIAVFILIVCFAVAFPYSYAIETLPYSCKKISPSSVKLTIEQWKQDLDFLGAELPKKHKNLYHNISETEFHTQIEELKAKLPSVNQNEIFVGLMRILASIGDSHTTLGYRPQQALPLMLYWFKDGIAILNTLAEYKEILYGKITALDGKAIEDVVATLAEVIPHENEAQVKNKIPNLLTDTVILQGMKLIPPSVNLDRLFLLLRHGTSPFRFFQLHFYMSLKTTKAQRTQRFFLFQFHNEFFHFAVFKVHQTLF